MESVSFDPKVHTFECGNSILEHEKWSSHEKCNCLIGKCNYHGEKCNISTKNIVFP